MGSTSIAGPGRACPSARPGGMARRRASVWPPPGRREGDGLPAVPADGPWLGPDRKEDA